MSYSNQTTHYGLPLPTASDRSVWTDNNTAFEAIDGAIYTASQNATGASEAVSAMATTVTGHTASISTLNADVATLSTSVTGIEGDLDTAESAISSLSTRVTAVEGKTATVWKVATMTIPFTDTTFSAGSLSSAIVGAIPNVANFTILRTRQTASGRQLLTMNAYTASNAIHVPIYNLWNQDYTNISGEVEVTYAYTE